MPPTELGDLDPEVWENADPRLKQVFPELVEKINQLVVTIDKLVEENKELRRLVNQDSTTSSRPPSSDQTWRRRRSKRKPSHRKQGAQKDHKGSSRPHPKDDESDDVEDHSSTECVGWGADLTVHGRSKGGV